MTTHTVKWMNNKDVVEERKNVDILVPYFNPCIYRNRKDNFSMFYNKLLDNIENSSCSVNLMIGEVELHDRSFELHNICEKEHLSFQIVAKDIMWRKEQILNRLLKESRNNKNDDDRNVIILDCDIIFKDINFIDSLCKQLSMYKFIQGFSRIAYLAECMDFNNLDISNLPYGNKICHQENGAIFNSITSNKITGNFGGCFAFRKECVDSLYDKNIMGGGMCDMVFASIFEQLKLVLKYNREYLSDFLSWSFNFTNKLSGSVSYADNDIFHLYHGKNEKRYYGGVAKEMKDSIYNPSIHLEKNNDGMYEFTDKGIMFQSILQKFFFSREEDN